MASARNKTIRLEEEECRLYASRALDFRSDLPKEALSLEEIENRVLFGDSFSLLPFLPPAFIDLAVVDPPYNRDKLYGGSRFGKKKDEEYRRFTRDWIEELLPHLKDDATVYVCADWQTGLLLAPLLAEYFTIKNRITWQREKGRGASANWKNGMEDIWYCTRSEKAVFCLDAVRQRRRVLAPYREEGCPKDWSESEEGRFRDTCPSNFWDDITIPYWSMAENTPHPTQKPEKLLAKLILASSHAGDMVFDPFLGSGSTAVTAAKLGRRFSGIEREELYVALAEKRLELAATDKRIQGYEEGIFYHRNAKSGS